MKKNKKNISLFKRIGLIAFALFSALGSFFVPLTKKQSNNYASADDTSVSYSFNGSSFYSISMQSSNIFDLSPNIIFYHLDTLLFKTSFYCSSDNIYFDFDNFAFIQQDRANPNGAYDYVIAHANLYLAYYLSDTVGDEGVEFNISNGVSNTVDSQFALRFLASYADDWGEQHYGIYDVLVTIDSGFNANISSVIFDHKEFYGYIRNFVSYIDFNGNALSFYFNSIENDPDHLFNRRVYFLYENLSDNVIYNQGYNDGLADNQQNIYNNGYNAGYDIGKGDGFSDGVSSANDYSFTGLFSSVLEVPIKTFTGLFNFNFLGVNLLDFFFGILTFSLIIFVVKLLLGGH